MFLKNRNISSKIKRSKVTDYAALNDTPTSSPSLQAVMAMSWVGHFSVVTLRVNTSGTFHRTGYLMLNHFVDTTIQVENLVNYNCNIS